jgi:hypothetical protein
MDQFAEYYHAIYDERTYSIACKHYSYGKLSSEYLGTNRIGEYVMLKHDHNIKNGETTWITAGGWIHSHSYTRNGLLDGRSIEYYDRVNTPKKRCYWCKGKFSGELIDWNRDGTVLRHHYYIDNRIVADLTVRIVMSLLSFKHRLQMRFKSYIIQRFLDSSLISDLGNIVMLYYFKE